MIFLLRKLRPMPNKTPLDYEMFHRGQKCRFNLILSKLFFLTSWIPDDDNESQYFKINLCIFKIYAYLPTTFPAISIYLSRMKIKKCRGGYLE